MKLGFRLGMRQARVAVGVRFAILFATVFFVVAALCDAGSRRQLIPLTPADDWISVIDYDPSQPGPLVLKMEPKTEDLMDDIRRSHRFFKEFGPSDESYTNENLLIDMMLKEQTHIYVGGAGSCAGCGEGTALRMMCAATGAKFGYQ